MKRNAFYEKKSAIESACNDGGWVGSEVVGDEQQDNAVICNIFSYPWGKSEREKLRLPVERKNAEEEREVHVWKGTIIAPHLITILQASITIHSV